MKKSNDVLKDMDLLWMKWAIAEVITHSCWNFFYKMNSAC